MLVVNSAECDLSAYAARRRDGGRSLQRARASGTAISIGTLKRRERFTMRGFLILVLDISDYDNRELDDPSLHILVNHFLSGFVSARRRSTDARECGEH